MEYKTIEGEYRTQFEISHSLFICSLKGVKDMDEGNFFVEKIAKEFNDATHNCYAIILKNGSQKLSDDGEPSGTAAFPISLVIKKQNIVNAVAVVTRYFGGIKLGAGGLVGAYTKAVADTFNIAKSVIMTACKKAEISLDYGNFSLLKKYINSVKSKIIETVFSDEVLISFVFPIEDENVINEKISEITSGKNALNIVNDNCFYNLDY